jgi:hypothetical protein
MNNIAAICGHMTPAIGAPYSQERFKCECSPCYECSQKVHCKDHSQYEHDCHWCNLSKRSFLQMTRQEQKLMYNL